MEYIMFHKPQGCITASRDARRQTVFDRLPEDFSHRLFAVGRLDRDTEGLLLLTDDGALCARLLHPSTNTEKRYEFYCIGEPTEQGRAALETGTPLDANGEIRSAPARFEILGTATLSCIADKLSANDAKRCRKHPDTPVLHAALTVTEGKKHQVKRMMLSVGCRIVYLRRTAFGALSLDPALPVGGYRSLTPEEILSLGKDV